MERIVVLAILDSTDWSVTVRAFSAETGKELEVELHEILWDENPEALLQEFRVKARLAAKLRAMGSRDWRDLAEEALQAREEYAAILEEEGEEDEMLLDPEVQELVVLLEEGEYGPGLRSLVNQKGGGVGVEQC